MASHAGTCFDTDPKTNQAYDAAGRATKSPVQSTPAMFAMSATQAKRNPGKSLFSGDYTFLT